MYIGSSALLVCTTLQPQITHKHCSKFSVVMPMSIWMSKNSCTVSLSVVSNSHWHIGKLTSSYSFTVSVGWIRLYCVCAFIYPVFIDNLHRRQWIAPFILAVQSSEVVNHAHENINIIIRIHGTFYGVHWTWKQGVQQDGSQEPG